MELDASEQERRQLAYSTQFFDFTPDAFVDGVSGACYEAINEHLDVCKNKCASEFVGKVDEQNLEDAFTLIKDAYQNNAEEVFDKFGRYVKKNIIQIPPDIVLPEDRAHLDPEAKGYSGMKLQEDLKDFENIKQEVINARYRKSVLEAKLANLEKVTERQQELLKQVELFEAENQSLDMVDEQLVNLKKKMASMTPVLESIENNIPSGSAKHKLELEEANFAKKIRFDNKEN